MLGISLLQSWKRGQYIRLLYPNILPYLERRSRILMDQETIISRMMSKPFLPYDYYNKEQRIEKTRKADSSIIGCILRKRTEKPQRKLDNLSSVSGTVLSEYHLISNQIFKEKVYNTNSATTGIRTSLQIPTDLNRPKNIWQRTSLPFNVMK